MVGGRWDEAYETFWSRLAGRVTRVGVNLRVNDGIDMIAAGGCYKGERNDLEEREENMRVKGGRNNETQRKNS